MKAKIDTYDNRIEISISLPDGVDNVDGGATIATDDDGANPRAVWTFGPDADPEQAATECKLILIASTPGVTVEPQEEQPVETRTIEV